MRATYSLHLYTAFNIGLARRFCNSNGIWETANVTDCESKTFREARVIVSMYNIIGPTVYLSLPYIQINIIDLHVIC